MNISVTVLKVGSFSRVVSVPAGSTIESALRVADVSPDGMSFAKNGRPATLGTTLEDGDTVSLTAKVVGGKR